MRAYLIERYDRASKSWLTYRSFFDETALRKGFERLKEEFPEWTIRAIVVLDSQVTE